MAQAKQSSSGGGEVVKLGPVQPGPTGKFVPEVITPSPPPSTGFNPWLVIGIVAVIVAVIYWFRK